MERTIHDLLFVGFNSRIAALDRFSGEIVWEWKAPKGSGFVSMILDGDRLIASARVLESNGNDESDPDAVSTVAASDTEEPQATDG